MLLTCPLPSSSFLRQSAQQSIADLGCEYLDLLLMHWPVAWRKGAQEVDTSVTLMDTW